MTITCVWQGKNILGEGPLWDFRSQLLYWLDIEQSQLLQLNPNTNELHNFNLPDKPGAIALREKGGLLIALRQELIFFDPNTGATVPWTSPLADHPDIAFNDGKCDRQGRFWIGAKDKQETNPIGALYRITALGESTTMATEFIVPNGLGWSPDNRYFYFTDGGSHRRILRYDFDSDTGNIYRRHIFADISPNDGIPDGLTVDSEGYIWSAHWDGWRITRYAPDGSIDRVIELPAPNITSCCFGGAELNILYITTATRDLTKAQLAQAPQAGGLFALETDVKGLSEPLFKQPL